VDMIFLYVALMLLVWKQYGHPVLKINLKWTQWDNLDNEMKAVTGWQMTTFVECYRPQYALCTYSVSQKNPPPPGAPDIFSQTVENF